MIGQLCGGGGGVTILALRRLCCCGCTGGGCSRHVAHVVRRRSTRCRRSGLPRWRWWSGARWLQRERLGPLQQFGILYDTRRAVECIPRHLRHVHTLLMEPAAARFALHQQTEWIALITRRTTADETLRAPVRPSPSCGGKASKYGRACLNRREHIEHKEEEA
jgi:hypothetical protein